MKQSTDAMIRALATELAPVKPLAPIRHTIAMALGIITLLAVYWVYRYELRQQFLNGEAPSVAFASVVVVLLLLASGGLVAGLAGSIPGREEASRVGGRLFVTGLVVGLAGFFYAWAVDVMSLGDGLLDSMRCIKAAAILAPPMSAFVFYSVVRGSALHPARALALASVAGVACAAGTVLLTCPHLEPLHLALGHAVPPLAAGAVASLIFSAAFALRRRVSTAD